MADIRFRFAAPKARSALHWMLSRESIVEIHAALKACYFADKAHLNKYHRPIFGATYRAMKFGPVPLEIYEMAKGEALWLAELRTDSFPWEIQGHSLRLTGNSEVDRTPLSRSNMEALENGLKRSLSMNFNERTAATHGKDWQAAQLGIMRYEDMIDEGPEKERIVEYLRENGLFMKL